MPPIDSPLPDRDQLARGLDPLFGDLPPDILAEVAEHLEPRRLQAGEVLVRQGDPCDGIHIVLSGRLRAARAGDDGEERDVAEIGTGESVGETSLLSRRPHSVTYRALRDTQLVRLSHAAFVELSHTQPGLLWSVARLVTDRLDQTRRGTGRPTAVRTVALLFLDDRVDRDGFRTRLRRALRRHGPETCIDSAAARTLAEDLWTDGAFDRLESSHRFVLMPLDDEPTSWSRRCVRQADRILLVAAAAGDPDPTRREQALLEDLPAGSRTACELVLVHDSGAADPAGTARWLAGRDLVRHHHLRATDDRDHARVARFLAGAAVGLALAGGGAKAFVHLGVIRALAEAGVPVDLVGGSSLGAIVAAGVARGWSPDELAENCRRAFTGRNPLADYTFPPLISMMRGRRAERLLRRFFGEAHVEDLWLPYLCISGDFSAGAMAVHRRGLLWRAIKASISLPGLMPPTVVDGHLHVDGGTFDNLPVDALRQAGAGRVIASDIWMPNRAPLTCEDTPSGWRYLLDRYLLRRRRNAIPHIMTTLFRSSFLASTERRRQARDSADLTFSSPSGRIGLTHWKKLDDAMAAGYSHAQRRLAETDPEALARLGVEAAGAEGVDRSTEAVG